MSALRDAASPAPPKGAGAPGTVLASEDAEALQALAAYFGGDDDGLDARIVVAGETLGYVDRDSALDLIELQPRGTGDSINAVLPGVSDYDDIELRCDVAGCPANPIVAATFDETYPPSCPDHPGHPLTRASA